MQDLDKVQNSLHQQSMRQTMSETSEFKTFSISRHAVLSFFLDTYIPEQLRLDDELERSRIECIADLAREKDPLIAVYREMIPSKEDTLLTPRDVFVFASQEIGDVVTEEEV